MVTGVYSAGLGVYSQIEESFGMAPVMHTQNTMVSQNTHQDAALLSKLHQEKLQKDIIVHKKQI